MLLTDRANPINKITAPLLIRILFLFALPLAVCSPGSAASLLGKVVDVVDGGSIVVECGKHSLKVKLVAVAALEKDQAYADVARQHLSDLVLNKDVLVRYSLLRDGFLVGQVMSGNMDVGAQMIRDGVAWYDKSEEHRLEGPAQQVYAASQEAAHSERRGLWQDESPMSPWDFRKAKASAPPPASTLSSAPREASSLRRGSQTSLSSEDLMGGVIGPGSLAGKPDSRRISADGSSGQWIRYQPADRHFSILVPSDAYEVTAPVLDEQGKVQNVNYVVAKNDSAIYFLMWAKGPKGGYTDASMADEAMKNMLAGMNRSAERSGVVIKATPDRNLNVSGYVGKQFTLSGAPVKGVIRVLSKQIGDDREMFLLFVMTGPESEASGNEFLSSLKIGQSSSK